MHDIDGQPSVHEWRRGGFLISTDPGRLDLDLVHGFLANEAYWSPGVERGLVERAIQGSLVFGLYDEGNAQIGFSRVVTDGALFAYLRDVFVLKSHRGKGLGLWLTERSLNHPALRSVKRWMLSTDDAHALYAKFGFKPLSRPDVYMLLLR
jgi:GNAT superfamily N-acetyltransferase